MRAPFDDYPTLHRVVLTLCAWCIDGKGGMCHTPGCALIRNLAPDMSIRHSCHVETIDGVPFDFDTLKRSEVVVANDV